MAARENSPASQTDRQGLVLTRMFDAPRDLVFRAWTQPEHLVHWWGQPNGATMPHCRVDLRVGGALHYCVHLPDGQLIWGKGVYREIVEPERLVFADYFSDEQGNVVEPPPGLPKETLVIATFEEHGGKTKVTIEHVGVEQASEQNRQLYRQGWADSLDRLAARLAAVAGTGSTPA